MKKILVIALMLVLCLSLCFCTNVNDTDENNNNNTENNSDVVIEEKDDETVLENPVQKTVHEVVLYFPDDEALYLHAESRSIELEEGASLAEAIVEELFKGPVTEGLSQTLEGENLVNSIVVSDGTCTVDFKGDFSILNSGGTARETFAIGSIVNSLCVLDDVERVKINIDGNENAEYGGHFTLDAPFTYQHDLIG